MEPTEKKEPTEAIEHADPIEPIERTDPLEPIERNESSDHNDQRDVAPVLCAMALIMPRNVAYSPVCNDNPFTIRLLGSRVPLAASALARSCCTHRQDCTTWHSDSSRDHRRRRNRCRNCWLFCETPATATFEMHAARWASRNARPEASSLEPRSMCSWSNSVTPSRVQTSWSKSRHGGATPERRCCARLRRSTSPWSSVVVAGPWSSRSSRPSRLRIGALAPGTGPPDRYVPDERAPDSLLLRHHP